MAATGTTSPTIEEEKKSKKPRLSRKDGKKKRKKPLRIHVLQLRPTQFVVGYVQVAKLVARTNQTLAEAKTKKERKKRLHKMMRRKKIPVVVGPGETMYMIDHHHWSKAVWDSDLKFAKKNLYYHIIADFSHLDEPQFWEEMKRNNWMYLQCNGESLSHELLPADVTTLQNDPYRALARAVRGKRRGWRKTNIPFCELLWADYLRAHSASFISLAGEGDIDDRDNHAAFELAVVLCQAEDAAMLPGFFWRNQYSSALGPLVGRTCLGK